MAIVYYNNYKGMKLYEGDTTSNGCGISKKDIDFNFFNLRSSDIKTASWDSKKRQLIITLYDGRNITVGNIDPYSIQYKENTNTLYGITPDGTEFEITSGVYTDSTLEGDNKPGSPITLAKSQRSGFRESVLSIVSSKEEAIENGINGGRYLLKTKESPLGRLYTKAEAIKIGKYLKEIGSEWRVATAQDWIDMLNGAEPCEEDKNYGATEIGNAAGDMLKDSHLWDGYNAYGFSVVPFEGEAYFIAGDKCRYFDDKSGPVKLVDSPMGFIRLVKDNDYHANESIFGETYECVKMPTWNKGYQPERVWTVNNVNIASIEGNAIGTELNYEGDYAYYIIETVTKESCVTDSQFKLKLGDSVFNIADNTIYTLVQDKDRKYVLETVNDIVVNSIASSYYNPATKEIKIKFNENNTISEVALNVNELIQVINETINDTAVELTDDINTVKSEFNSKLNAEKNARVAKDEELSSAVNSLMALLELSSNITEGSIATLTKYFGDLKNEDKRQQKEIDTAIASIVAEIDNRKDGDAYLSNRIKELEDTVALIDVAGDINAFKALLQEQLLKEFDKLGSAATAETNAKAYTDKQIAALRLADTYETKGTAEQAYARASAYTNTEIAKVRLDAGDGIKIEDKKVSVKISPKAQNPLKLNENGELEVIVDSQSVPVIADNVADVVYDKTEQTIYLIDKDGEKIGTGFDASDFAAQSVIKEVTLSGDTLIFIFPGQEGEDDIVKYINLSQLISDEVIAELKRGTVQDVKVNGESCVTNGIANIELNVFDEDKERAIAGALNYLWRKMKEIHPEISNN